MMSRSIENVRDNERRECFYKDGVSLAATNLPQVWNLREV